MRRGEIVFQTEPSIYGGVWFFLKTPDLKMIPFGFSTSWTELKMASMFINKDETLQNPTIKRIAKIAYRECRGNADQQERKPVVSLYRDKTGELCYEQFT